MSIPANNKDKLYEKMPHGGSMRLIDQIIDVDDTNILCETLSHQDTQNPLRSNNHLDAIHSVEYAAQAAGLHLTKQAQAPESKHSGFLAAIQSFELHTDILDNAPERLLIKCHQVFVDNRGCIYEFNLSSNNETLAQGRFLIVFS